MNRKMAIATMWLGSTLVAFILGRLTAPGPADMQPPPEVCNGLDNDCGGALAEGEDVTFMLDNSGSMATLMPEIARLAESYAEEFVDGPLPSAPPGARETVIIIVPLILVPEPEPAPTFPAPPGPRTIDI